MPGLPSQISETFASAHVADGLYRQLVLARQIFVVQIRERQIVEQLPERRPPICHFAHVDCLPVMLSRWPFVARRLSGLFDIASRFPSQSILCPVERVRRDVQTEPMRLLFDAFDIPNKVEKRNVARSLSRKFCNSLHVGSFNC
jgi:hypothetical protein